MTPSVDDIGVLRQARRDCLLYGFTHISNASEQTLADATDALARKLDVFERERARRLLERKSLAVAREKSEEPKGEYLMDSTDEDKQKCREIGHVNWRAATEADRTSQGLLPDGIGSATCMRCGWQEINPWT